MKVPRMGYTKEFRRRIGEMLLAKPRRGDQRKIAKILEVSERTLNNWKRAAIGAQDLGQKVKQRDRIAFKEKLQIAREWQRQGNPGSRPVIAALGARARAVRSVVTELKLRKKQRAIRARKRVQVRIKVKEVGAILVADGASTKKGADYIVHRDRASLSVQVNKCINGVLSSMDTIGVLNDIKNKNLLPLVFCTDNGTAFCCQETSNFLESNQVIHLRSLPGVPQHNGSCENAVKEFKELIRAGKSPDEAEKILNVYRKRRQLNYRTSQEYRSENFRKYTEEERRMFYNTAKAAIKKAVLDAKSEYERKKAEREAILQTMERFSIIERTRGGLMRLEKPEENL